MKFLERIGRKLAVVSSGLVSTTLLSSVVLLSFCAGAAPAPATSSGKGFKGLTSDSNKFFISGTYYGDFFTNIDKVKGSENGGMAGQLYALDKNGIATTKIPDYKSDYIAGGVLLGISFAGGYRIELEGQYANVVLDDEGTSNGNLTYLEIARTPSALLGSNTGMLGWYSHDSDIYKLNAGSFSKASTGYAIGGVLVDPGTVNIIPPTPTPTPPTPPTPLVVAASLYADGKSDMLATKYTNGSIRFIGGFVNIGYDITIPGSKISPFVTLGAGIAQTQYMGQTDYGFAYQAKAGASYSLTDDISVFLGYDYRGTLEQSYTVTPNNKIFAVSAGGNVTNTNQVHPSPNAGKNVNVGDIIAPSFNIAASSTAKFTTAFGVHGLFGGLTLKF